MFDLVAQMFGFEDVQEDIWSDEGPINVYYETHGLDHGPYERYEEYREIDDSDYVDYVEVNGGKYFEVLKEIIKALKTDRPTRELIYNCLEEYESGNEDVIDYFIETIYSDDSPINKYLEKDKYLSRDYIDFIDRVDELWDIIWDMMERMV
jgi:hypothetical protein